MIFINNFIELLLEAAPWLLFGMVVAGLVKAWAPQEGMARLLGGRGLGSIINGALIGAPLPICSCGVLPAAISLRRSGASREATTSFLVATPETGVDSVTLSYGMLGPFMAIARPIAAISSAIGTGLMMRFLPNEEAVPVASVADSLAATSCCGSSTETAQVEEPSSCCGSSAETSQSMSGGFSYTPAAIYQRTSGGLRYALVDIFNDIVVWMLFGLLLAAVTMTWIPPQTLGTYGSGILAMLIMVVIGIPMYICATASTPIAASLLMAGVSPGAAMVFMLAGPATNIGTMGVVRKEMGNRAVALYLTGVIATALIAGLITDYVVLALEIDMAVQISGDSEIVPEWLAIASAAFLTVLALRPLTNKLMLTITRIKELIQRSK